MEKLRKISYKIATSIGVVIDPKDIVEVPTAKCPYSQKKEKYKVYAAHTAEICIIAYYFADNQIKIKII